MANVSVGKRQLFVRPSFSARRRYVELSTETSASSCSHHLRLPTIT